MTTFSEQFPIVFQALNIGFLQTLKLFFVTLIGAIPLGLIISFGSMSSWAPLGFLRPLLKNLPKNTKLTWWQRFQIWCYVDFKPIRIIVRFIIWVVRGTPLLVQLFVVFYGLPDVGILLDPFPAAVLVFAVNEGAYCAETMRAALESVPVGQIEAGYCVGMRYMQIMRRIVLPQALRTAFPPLSNSLIAMVKDTSLASNITVMEMFMATQRIAARTYEMLPLYCEVAVVYLMFSTVLTFVQRWGEKKLAVYGGRRRAK